MRWGEPAFPSHKLEDRILHACAVYPVVKRVRQESALRRKAPQPAVEMATTATCDSSSPEPGTALFLWAFQRDAAYGIAPSSEPDQPRVALAGPKGRREGILTTSSPLS